MSEVVTDEALIALAADAQERAYAPYSCFRVGAAVVAGSGRVYTGCNVENASYPLCCCAERVAIYTAVAAGERAITRVAVVTDATPPVAPCGGCRQVIREFGAEVEVIYANRQGEAEKTTIATLLPVGFSGEQLKRA